MWGMLLRNFPAFVDNPARLFLRRNTPRLLLGGGVPWRGLQSTAISEAFDVLEHVGPAVSTRTVMGVVGKGRYSMSRRNSHRRIVPANVPAPYWVTHAAHQPPRTVAVDRVYQAAACALHATRWERVVRWPCRAQRREFVPEVIGHPQVSPVASPPRRRVYRPAQMKRTGDLPPGEDPSDVSAHNAFAGAMTSFRHPACR